MTATLLGSTAMADVPSVAVDIAPVHSLVARVMQGVGEPDLIVPAGASPHEFSLRPSQAGALQGADLVFWMGEGLTPWMEDALETLAGDAAVTTLLEIDETSLLEFREGALFEAHDHDDHGDDGDHDGHDDHDDHDGHDDHDDHDGHDDHDDHAEDEHDDHDDHAEDEHHDHDGHAEDKHDDHDDHAEDKHGDHDEDEHAEDAHGDEDHAAGDHHDEHHEHDDQEAHDDHDDHGDDHDDHGDDHAGHDHGAHDPHAWLSTGNASAWLNVIAAQLSAADPDNAGAYFANAAAGRAEIEALEGEINAMLDPVRGKSFVVFHDAYQYFETSFDFPASGVISLGDASDPSPARIAEIQGRVKEEGIDCVLAEPQYNPGMVAVVLDGTQAKTGVLDPLGSDLEPGADMYPQLLRNLAGALSGCL
nr:zinc ABC transporter substrate-binding protein [Candidatus Rhodobacter lobularis]